MFTDCWSISSFQMEIRVNANISRKCSGNSKLYIKIKKRMHRIVKTILKRNTIYRRSVLIYQYKIYYNHHDKISENRRSMNGI